MRWLQHTAVKIVITLVVSVVFAHFITFISSHVNFLEKFSIAVTDIDFTDQYYHTRPHPERDTNIVIVNIGDLSRRNLAVMIGILSECKPKVMGVDVFFVEESSDVLGTNMLADVFQQQKNVVLISAYRGKDKQGRDTVEAQSTIIGKNVIQALVNLNIATDDPEMGTVRSFNPVTDINGEKKIAFGYTVSSFLDSTMIAPSQEDDEFIRWYGYGYRNEVPDSLRIFPTLDWPQVLRHEFDTAQIRGKILLLGFMGDSLTGKYASDEKFFSPLNGKMIGRSLPDIYGVEIHANIIRMILSRAYITHSDWIDYAVNYFILILFSVTLIWFHKKYEKQYSILSKIVLIGFIDILFLMAIQCFALTDGGLKLLIGEGLFVILFMPDTYEFLEANLFGRYLYKTEDIEDEVIV